MYWSAARVKEIGFWANPACCETTQGDVGSQGADFWDFRGVAIAQQKSVIQII